MPNHKQSKARDVEKGRAVAAEVPLAHVKMLSTEKMEKITPGTRAEVNKLGAFQDCPPITVCVHVYVWLFK